jgi:hypothetical protein
VIKDWGWVKIGVLVRVRVRVRFGSRVRVGGLGLAVIRSPWSLNRASLAVTILVGFDIVPVPKSCSGEWGGGRERGVEGEKEAGKESVVWR